MEYKVIDNTFIIGEKKVEFPSNIKELYFDEVELSRKMQSVKHPPEADVMKFLVL